MGAIVRPARAEDAESLQQFCYPGESLEDVRDYLAWCLDPRREGQIARWVTDVAGQAVGNVQLTRWGDWGEVGSLVIAPGFRRRGLGRRLLETVVTQARQLGLCELTLTVHQDDLPAQRLYRQAGFAPAGPHQKKEELFLSGDHDCWVLHLQLGP